MAIFKAVVKAKIDIIVEAENEDEAEMLAMEGFEIRALSGYGIVSIDYDDTYLYDMQKKNRGSLV